METYNFQWGGVPWTDREIKTAEFSNRSQAVDFARGLSQLFNTEIRLTTGNAMQDSGSYINA